MVAGAVDVVVDVGEVRKGPVISYVTPDPEPDGPRWELKYRRILKGRTPDR